MRHTFFVITPYYVLNDCRVISEYRVQCISFLTLVTPYIIGGKERREGSHALDNKTTVVGIFSSRIMQSKTNADGAGKQSSNSLSTALTIKNNCEPEGKETGTEGEGNKL